MVASGLSTVEVRGVSHNYLVLPSGAELGADLKLVTADSFEGMPLHFADLALFTLTGRVGLGGRVDILGATTFIPKQPSYSDEKVWQSASGEARLALGRAYALSLSGAGGHLLSHEGEWLSSSLVLERRKPVTEYLSFDLRGGFDAVTITASESTASLGEIAFSAATHFHDPWGYSGGWLGVAYALPVAWNGTDPTTGLAIDPQPRLDLHLGAVLSPTADWDVYIDGAVIDRGDASKPATQLPILDGGFSQRQITLGVVRHFKPTRRVGHHSDDDSGNDLIIGRR